ncbi:unnamed protein product [Schistocephalus solidus]|uniref:Amino acid adenylation n=1 Tax=Schistocephalus solidus TaxID=70667 RepID=A0A183T5N0_SCHSO|nr:unnamed protein product [Schistocephalus solidus]
MAWLLRIPVCSRDFISGILSCHLSFSLVREDGTGICSAKECRQDDGLVYLPFGVQVNIMAIPHEGLQLAEDLTGFEDPLTNLIIDSHVA